MSCIQCRKTHFVFTHKCNWKIKVDLPTYEVLTKRIHIFVYFIILLLKSYSYNINKSIHKTKLRTKLKIIDKFPVGMV